MLLRFEGAIPAAYQVTLLNFGILLVGYRIISSIVFRLHRWSFRFSGLADGARIGMAGLCGSGLLLGTIYLLRGQGVRRGCVARRWFRQ